MRWFRLYNEFAYDPKTQTLSETFQRRYIMLLCLKCNGDLPKLTEEEIAFALRITPEELQKTKETFIKKCFIDDSWNILNWDKRQYVSDTSTERVRKHREKQSETFQKRSETVTVTPPEQIQNRTDTEKKQVTTNKNDKNKRFIIPTIEEINSYCKERKNQVNPQMFIDHYKSNGWMVGKNKMKDWKATIRTWEQRDYGGQHGKTGSDYKTNWEREQDMEAEAINREYREAKAKEATADGNTKKNAT